MEDGICEIAYAELRDRLLRWGVNETDHADCCAVADLGCRYFVRHRVGGGGPYYPIVYRGDDDIICPPTIRFMLATFGISPRQWLSEGTPVITRPQNGQQAESTPNGRVDGAVGDAS